MNVSSIRGNRVFWDHLAPERSYLAKACLVAAGIFMLTISAKIQVPFYPVPMTMQTAVVLLIGFAMGPAGGVATVLAYLAMGALGLPVFAGTPVRGIGLAYMAGPTGGYLVGFAAAAAIAGFFARFGRDRGFLSALTAACLATVVIFGCGVAWLGYVVGFEKDLMKLGVYPFLPGAVFKILLVSAAMPSIWKFAKPGIG